MMKQKIVLHFPPRLVEEPIIYYLIKEYDLVVNILRADINPEKEGRLMVELTGEESKYKQAVRWLSKQGLQVMNLEKQIIWRADKCTHCGACTAVCPTEALSLKRPEFTVSFKEESCIICELCLRACPAKAMETLVDSSDNK